MPTVCKKPSGCTADELREFVELDRAGGKIKQPQKLPERVLRAKCLAFHRVRSQLVGIAALKVTRDTYTEDVFEQRAFCGDDWEKFGLEVGYVYVVPEYQGKHISRKVVEAVLRKAKGQNVFATTEPGGRMCKTLERLGFERCGGEYEAEAEGDRLVLYLRRS